MRLGKYISQDCMFSEMEETEKNVANSVCLKEANVKPTTPSAQAPSKTSSTESAWVKEVLEKTKSL